MTRFLAWFYFLSAPLFVFGLIPWPEFLWGIALFFSLRLVSFRLRLGTTLYLLLFVSALFFFHFRPNLFANQASLNIINSQRGEHIGSLLASSGKLFHNKTAFAFDFVANLESFLSPVKIFAAYPSSRLDPYYSLGLLRPWDFLLLLLALAVLRSRPALTPVLLFSFSLLPVGLMINSPLGPVLAVVVSLLCLLPTVNFLQRRPKLLLIFSFLNLIFLLVHFFSLSAFRS